MLEEVTLWGKNLPHEVTSSIIEAACGVPLACKKPQRPSAWIGFKEGFWKTYINARVNKSRLLHPFLLLKNGASEVENNISQQTASSEHHRLKRAQ